jgi:hypothetical protein
MSMMPFPADKLFGLVSCMLLVVVLFFSCKQESITPSPIDTSYFPLQTGKYIIYDLDSVVYSNFFNTTDSFSFQVMEYIDSSYTDAGNEEAYRIVRSRREDENSPWIITDIWSANLTDHTAEKVEDNLRFIKLDFPVVLNKTWKGNSKINTDSPLVYLSDWDYEYTEVNVPLTVDTMQFDSVLTVSQFDEENAIEKIIYTEKYAKNIGLIYKEEQNLQTQPSQYPDGFILKMTIHAYN